MKEIKLTTGEISIIDDEDFEKVKPFNWCRCGDGYADASINKKRIYLHRFILNAKHHQSVDHKNGNRLDNRKNNLRLCTVLQNSYNRGKQNNNTSGYKGVVWCSYGKNWKAQIWHNRKKICLGHYRDIKKAAQAYNDASKKYHGNFSYQNLI